MHIAELTFLAVEDHEFQRGVLLKVLAGLGATKVSWAADGRAALKLVKAGDPPIDIIISDLNMPGMDGMEFRRHLGEAGIPVSIILASVLERPLLASVETMTRAYGVRILGVIEKPVTPAKLDALIRLHEPAQPDLTRPGTGTQMAGPSFTAEEILEGLKNDEFEPLFQPKVELATGCIKGAEALVRWLHPQQGIVAPSGFIKALEDSHQTDRLTRSMLRRSAAFCREWRKASRLEVTVAINLSIESLAQVQLAERATDVVRGENLDPRHMIFEVTESATTTNLGKTLENLSRLRMNGFGLSIDDYGTGDSSMQQLTQIAFTELRIDRSFVANAARQQSARVVLESSLDMAKKLNITSVATGIESRQDWVLLRQLGCQLGQGDFIGKPMNAGTFLKWARDRTHVDAIAL